MPHNLLLADDSVTIQRVIKLTFADEDVDVVTVGDGDQAVAAIEKAPPDIVLADIAMPGRSGYDVAHHIRTHPHLAHIPVVLLTGAFEPVDEARAFEVGCDGVLAKPFEPEVVVSRVRELLLRGRAVPLPAAAVAAPEPAAPELAAPAPARSAVDIDAYFDRLDQAFANLATSPRSAAVADAGEPESSVFGDPLAAPSSPQLHEPAMQSIVDTFQGMLVGEPPAMPAPVVPVVAPPPPPPVADVVNIAAVTASPVQAAAALSEAQVDQIVNRVLDALTARMATGNLSEMVAQTAERLVRAELDEIKSRL